MPSPSRVAAALRAWREARGMTRRVAAMTLCVMPRTLERWEQGRGLPRAAELIRLIDAGISLTLHEIRRAKKNA